MSAFWPLARRMLTYRRPLAGAAVAAIVSAVGLGAGLLGIAPILDALIGNGKTLAEIAISFNDRSPFDIPPSVIDAMPTKPFTAAMIMVSALAVLTVIGAVANFLHMFLSLTVVERTVARIRAEMFERVIHMPLGAIAAEGADRSVSRVVNDPQQLGAGFNALLSKGVAQITKGIAAFIAAIVINAELTLITLIVAPAMAVVIRKLGKQIRRASKKALEKQAGLYAAAGEVVHGLPVVKTFNAERRELARFHRENKAVLSNLLRARTARAMSSPITEAMAILIVAGLALIAVKAVDDNEIDPTSMILAIASLGVAGASLRPLTGVINDIQQSTGAADRIAETLAQPREIPRDDSRKTLPKLPRLSNAIRFENITYAYPGATDPALRDIDLEINKGETVALVGPNGSGKTTLLSLVPRLFDPREGRVTVDGVDVKTVSVRSLRQQIGVVTQHSVLFSGTIRHNIAYGVRGATTAQIEAAAQAAHAERFIAERGGYETVIGERGAGLSGGQRQRIAIARAIIRDPAILLLDEATSMIDAESEALINDALANLAEGRTTLVVAHRLSTVLSADRIVVMDQGRIVDAGAHDQLLARCPTYRSIAQHQLTREDTTNIA